MFSSLFSAKLRLAEHKEAVPKFVCRVEIDGCGAGDKTTGVPGSAEPRGDMRQGRGLQCHLSKCYVATLFISHVSTVQFVSLYVYPTRPIFYTGGINAVFFFFMNGFKSLNIYAIFHKTDRNNSI